MKTQEKIITKTPKETKEFAQKLLKKFGKASLWLLSGNLGSGKTVFVKGLGKGLKIDEKKIKSPTFTFRADLGQLIHYDLYRLEKADDLLFEQIEEDIKNSKTVVIEWPEIFVRAHKNFIKNHPLTQVLLISFAHKSKTSRLIQITPIRNYAFC